MLLDFLRIVNLVTFRVLNTSDYVSTSSSKGGLMEEGCVPFLKNDPIGSRLHCLYFLLKLEDLILLFGNLLLQV